MSRAEEIEAARAQLATDPAAALAQIDTLLPLAVDRDRVQILILRTRALRALGQHMEALTTFAEAKDAAEAIGDTALATQLQVGAVDSLGMLGRYDEAVALARSLSDRLLLLDLKVDAAKVQGNLGSLFLRQDRYEEALAAYAEAENLLQNADQPLLLAILAVNRAIALTYLGRTEEALTYYQQAVTFYDERQMPFEAAVTRANIGFLHHTSGRFAAALKELTAAGEFFAGAGRELEQARADLDIGDAYRALNLLPEAEASYTRALLACERLTIPDDQARARLGLAIVALETERYSDADPLLSTVATHFAGNGNQASLALVHLWQAESALRRQERENAARLAQTSGALFAACNLAGWAAEADFIAVSAEASPTPERFAAIAGAARQTRRGWLESRSEQAQGNLLRALGQRELAKTHLLRAVDALEAIRTQVAPEELHLAFIRDKENVYSDLIALLLEGTPETQDIADALYTLERSRSRLLLERLLSATASTEPATDFAEGVRGLRARLSQGYRDLLALGNEDARRPVSPPSLPALETLENAYATALQTLAATSEPTALAFSRLPSVDRLRSALAADEALLQFVEVDRRLTVFLLRPQGLQLYRSQTAWNEIGHVVRRFRYHLQKMNIAPELRAILAEGQIGEIDSVLERLHQLLIAPLALGEEVKRLIIVPQHPLHSLPFAALKTTTGYLGDRFEIVTTPSAAIWHSLRQRPEATRIAANPALLIGVSGSGTEQVAAELAAIREQMPAKIFLDASATLHNFRQEAPSAPILHLATHAFFRRDNPLFSGLQLYDDCLFGRDLYHLSLSAHLVTLSACDTGAVRIESGEEWLGLVRGFLTAGAQRLLVSLWPADDKATAELMGAFYRRINQGESPSAALQQSQQQVRQHWPHPYFWAAFTLLGKP